MTLALLFLSHDLYHIRIVALNLHFWSALRRLGRMSGCQRALILKGTGSYWYMVASSCRFRSDSLITEATSGERGGWRPHVRNRRFGLATCLRHLLDTVFLAHNYHLDPQSTRPAHARMDRTDCSVPCDRYVRARFTNCLIFICHLARVSDRLPQDSRF